MPAHLIRTTRTVRNEQQLPLIQPERCAWCAHKAQWIRRSQDLAMCNPFIVQALTPNIPSKCGPNAETCACGHSLLRGFRVTAKLPAAPATIRKTASGKPYISS